MLGSMYHHCLSLFHTNFLVPCTSLSFRFSKDYFTPHLVIFDDALLSKGTVRGAAFKAISLHQGHVKL